MIYLSFYEGGNRIGFKDDSDKYVPILETDVLIDESIRQEFMDKQSLGYIIRGKNINGITFDEIFESIPPYVPTDAELAKNELTELDTVLPRCVEDIIVATGIDITTLPQIMQDRLSRKEELRAQLKGK